MLKDQLRVAALDAAPDALLRHAKFDQGFDAVAPVDQKGAGLVLAETIRSGNETLISQVHGNILGQLPAANTQGVASLYAHAISYDARHGGQARTNILSQLTPDVLQKFGTIDLLPFIAAVSTSSDVDNRRELDYAYDPIIAIDKVLGEIETAYEDDNLKPELSLSFTHILQSSQYHHESATREMVIERLVRAFNGPIMQKKLAYYGSLGNYYISDVIGCLIDSPEEFAHVADNLRKSGYEKAIGEVVYYNIQTGSKAALAYFERYIDNSDHFPEEISEDFLRQATSGYIAAGQLDKAAALLKKSGVFTNSKQAGSDLDLLDMALSLQSWGHVTASLAIEAHQAGRADLADWVSTAAAATVHMSDKHAKQYSIYMVGQRLRDGQVGHAVNLAMQHSVELPLSVLAGDIGAQAAQAVLEANRTLYESSQFLLSITQQCERMLLDSPSVSDVERVNRIKAAVQEAALVLIRQSNLAEAGPYIISKLARTLASTGDALNAMRLTMVTEPQEAELGVSDELTMLPNIHEKENAPRQKSAAQREVEEELTVYMALSRDAGHLRTAYELYTNCERPVPVNEKRIIQALLVGAMVIGDQELLVQLSRRLSYSKYPDPGTTDHTWRKHFIAAIQQVSGVSPELSEETLRALIVDPPQYGKLLRQPASLAAMLDHTFYRDYRRALV